MKGKDKKHVFTGFPDDCSPEQLEALKTFRAKVTAMGLTNPPYDDPYLLRFLRARKFDLVKTDKMFTDYINWRKENDVDNIDQYQFNELDEVKLYYPHGYHKTCKMGRPIYIEKVGMLKLQQLFSITSEERMMKYYIQSYEFMCNKAFPACTKARGTRVDQSFTILDLKGATMKMVGKQVYNFIQIASKIGQDNYPEILGRMFIVNAPMLFTGIWAVIKPWLDDRTKAKITIVGSSFQKQLLELIDEENLPEFLGGKCVCPGGDCLKNNIGPWNPDGTQNIFAPVKETKPNLAKDDEEEKNDKEELKNLKSQLAGLEIASNPNPKQKGEQYDENGKNLLVGETPLNTQQEEDETKEKN